MVVRDWARQEGSEVAKIKLLGTDSGRLPRIDRYELVAELASGGMATVYLGRILGVGGFERFVAIKRLHPHLGADESFVKMLLDEARLVANIRHPNVVPVLEVGGGDDGYYLVMEYIEGETLGAVLSLSTRMGKRLPAKVAVRVVLDTLAGLHAAHEMVDQNGDPLGLVHRDVSPQNILLDVHGVSRIADFGVAHATSRLGSTRAGQLKGKVAYMAPEQARGEAVTRRADVFAAGIVLWEALCMKRLFLAENEAITLNRLIFEDIPKLRAGNPAMPASLEQVLDRALDRDASRRFSTAAEFASELESVCRAARMLGDTNDVKAFVEETIGEGVEQRRNAIRAHLSFIDQPRGDAIDPRSGVSVRPVRPEPVVPPGSTVSSAIMTVPAVADDAEPLGVEDIVSRTGPALEQAQARPTRRGWPVLAVAMSVVALGAVIVAVLAARPGAGDGAGQRFEPSPVVSSVQVAQTAAGTASGAASAANTEVLDARDASAADAATALVPARTNVPVVDRPPPRATAVGEGKSDASPPSTHAAPAEPATTSTAAPADTDDLKKNPYR
jgi:serine/threonine protein kinase